MENVVPWRGKFRRLARRCHLFPRSAYSALNEIIVTVGANVPSDAEYRYTQSAARNGRAWRCRASSRLLRRVEARGPNEARLARHGDFAFHVREAKRTVSRRRSLSLIDVSSKYLDRHAEMSAAAISDKRALGERLPQHRALKGARYYCRPVVGRRSILAIDRR